MTSLMIVNVPSSHLFVSPLFFPLPLFVVEIQSQLCHGMTTFSTGQTGTRGRSFWQRCNRMEVWDLVTEIFVAPCNVCYRDVHGNLVFSN